MEQPVLQRQPRIGRHRHQRRRRQDRQRAERLHHRQPQRRLADLVVQRTAQDQLPARTPRPVSRPSAGHQIRGRGPVLPRLLLLPQSAHLRRCALLRPRARLDRCRRLQGAQRPRLRDGPRAGRFRLRGPKPSGHVGERQHPRDELGRAGLRQPRSALRGDVPQVSRHGRRRQIPPAGGRHGQGVHHRLALHLYEEGAEPYRELFYSENAKTCEVVLCRRYDKAFGISHSVPYTSSSAARASRAAS